MNAARVARPASPDAAGHARQVAEVVDPLDLYQAQPRRFGKRVGDDDDSWQDKRKVRGRRVQRPAANAVLTTAVDTWGRSWTPRCPSRSSGLLRRTAVDSRGPGNSPENREVACAQRSRATLVPHR